MKQRIPLAILMVVLTLVCCLVGPLPRLAFLLLCKDGPLRYVTH